MKYSIGQELDMPMVIVGYEINERGTFVKMRPKIQKELVMSTLWFDVNEMRILRDECSKSSKQLFS